MCFMFPSFFHVIIYYIPVYSFTCYNISFNYFRACFCKNSTLYSQYETHGMFYGFKKNSISLGIFNLFFQNNRLPTSWRRSPYTLVACIVSYVCILFYCSQFYSFFSNSILLRISLNYTYTRSLLYVCKYLHI